ncbi:hypothetical protein BGX27_003899 [Mortierella sp. AM989]|nr:hypothetical protein BGX27_003899 [Mortierella sp. AM989]
MPKQPPPVNRDKSNPIYGRKKLSDAVPEHVDTSSREPSESIKSEKRQLSSSVQDSQLKPSTTRSPVANDSLGRLDSAKNTIASPITPSPEPSKSLSANQWEKTAFAGDSDGAKRIKFLRLSNR